MEIKEQIAVMQAFADGKEIEMSHRNEDAWTSTPNPAWNWFSFDYRIKPESKLRPYTFDELQAEMAKGKIAVIRKDSVFKRILVITQVINDYGEDDKIQFSDFGQISYEQFLNGYRWLDGSPCGVIEEE